MSKKLPAMLGRGMDEERYLRDVIRAVLADGKIEGWDEVSALMVAMVSYVRDLTDLNDSEQIVAFRKLVDWADSEYSIIQRIDDAIDLKKYLGGWVGTIVEMLDGPLIRGGLTALYPLLARWVPDGSVGEQAAEPPS